MLIADPLEPSEPATPHVSGDPMLPSITTLVASVLVPASLLLPRTLTTTTISNEPVLQVSEATPLDLYIEELAQYESNGQEDISIIDRNHKASRGCLMFQDATFQEQSKKYGIKGDIMDCRTQKLLAREMFLHDPTAPSRWYTSVYVRGLGLPPVQRTRETL